MSNEQRSDGPEIELPVVDGRQCVPIRLLPFLTNWQTLSPDRITEFLGAGEPLQGRRWRISAHCLRSDGTFNRVLPGVWANLTEKLGVLATELRQSEEFEGQNDDEWERRSVAVLPAASFVWRDELEAEYERTYRRHSYVRPRPGARQLSESEEAAELETLISSTDPAELARIQQRALDASMTLDGDGSLSFSPVMTNEERSLAFDGFPIHAHESKAQQLKRRDTPRLEQQEVVILAKVEELGFSPLAFPKTKGRAGAKARVAAALPRYGKEVFNHAWKRLRKSARIKDG